LLDPDCIASLLDSLPSLPPPSPADLPGPAQPAGRPKYRRPLPFARFDLPDEIGGCLSLSERAVYPVLLKHMQDPDRREVLPMSAAQLGLRARVSPRRAQMAVRVLVDVGLFERVGARNQPAIYRPLRDYDRVEHALVEKGWAERTPHGVQPLPRPRAAPRPPPPRLPPSPPGEAPQACDRCDPTPCDPCDRREEFAPYRGRNLILEPPSLRSVPAAPPAPPEAEPAGKEGGEEPAQAEPLAPPPVAPDELAARAEEPAEAAPPPPSPAAYDAPPAVVHDPPQGPPPGAPDAPPAVAPAPPRRAPRVALAPRMSAGAQVLAEAIARWPLVLTALVLSALQRTFPTVAVCALFTKGWLSAALERVPDLSAEELLAFLRGVPTTARIQSAHFPASVAFTIHHFDDWLHAYRAPKLPPRDPLLPSPPPDEQRRRHRAALAAGYTPVPAEEQARRHAEFEAALGLSVPRPAPRPRLKR
jgi:hypothetical protein